MWPYLKEIPSQISLCEWALALSGIMLLLYIIGTWNYDYFQKRGIPSSKPKWPFIGDMLPVFWGNRSLPDLIKDQYNRTEGHGVYGSFQFTQPAFMIRDPEIIKVVTVKEFDSFMNHQSVQSEKMDPIIRKSLVNIKDQAWKDMRATLSPAFTSSKIKGMVPLISDCGHQMVQHLRQKYADSKEGALKQRLTTDMKELFSRWATDVIATAAFGVRCDSFSHPDNEFYHRGKALTTFAKLRIIFFLGYMLFPKIMQALGLRVLDRKATNFFDSLVNDTIRERQQKAIFRPDMLQLLMQAREGQLKAEKEDTAEAEEIGAKKTILLDEDVSAQAVLFFFAAFDNVSTAVCVTSHLLAHHEEVQNRLYAEVAGIMDKTGGKPTYKSIQDMKYLEAVIDESLRMYPPGIATDRVCGKDTILPAGDFSGPITVRKGQLITIPIIGLHHDPHHWPDPEKFDPDRFNDENKHNIKPFTYMPFGVGPRFCIGQRLALIEVKLALVHLIADFELHPSSKTKHPLELSFGFNLQAKEGFWCELKPRKI